MKYATGQRMMMENFEMMMVQKAQEKMRKIPEIKKGCRSLREIE
jgi:hypothetical protein